MTLSDKNIIIIGAGGHAQSILAIDAIGLGRIIGYTSPQPNPDIKNIKYIGGDEAILNTFNPDDIELVIGLSYVGKTVDLHLRKTIIDKFKNNTFARIIAKSAINKAERIGVGTILFERSVVNTGSIIGCNCVINTGAIVEHHCVIGDNVQISPGAIVLGGCTICSNTFIGAGAVIRDGVTIGADKIIPMGSIITKNTD